MFVSGGPLYLMCFGLCVLVVMSGMIYLLHFIFISLVLFFCLVCTTTDRKGRKVLSHKKISLRNNNAQISNFEEELPKPTVGKLPADSGPTANRQFTDRSIRPHNKSKIISLLEQSTNRTHFMVS